MILQFVQYGSYFIIQDQNKDLIIHNSTYLVDYLLQTLINPYIQIISHEVREETIMKDDISPICVS